MGKGEGATWSSEEEEFYEGGPLSCDVGGEQAWGLGVGWDPPKPDRVPDILGNLLESLRAET